jgi:hypothetical protein
MMRKVLFVIAAMMLAASAGMAQDTLKEGTVTYLSTKNVYVRFSTTSDMAAGDTLFMMKGGALAPALLIREMSSTSCVCVPLGASLPALSDKLYHKPAPPKTAAGGDGIPPSAVNEIQNRPDTTIVPAGTPVQQAVAGKTGKKSRQLIHGYFGIASYSDFSNTPAANSQRFKYTLSIAARNIGNSNVSAECYINYLQGNTNWTDLANNPFDGLKVYSFNVSYDFGERASLLLGRKINPKLSNMGANDGLQFELKFKPLSIGIIAGFRPDYTDYSFNSSLLQYGAYLYNETRAKSGRTMQTTLAFINQTNSGATDRRFMYLQHVNNLVKNLTFFGSAELDLYKMTFNPEDSSYTSGSDFHFTNLYFSLNYRVIKQLTLAFSYSARQNVIYYQTYKSLLDKLSDPQTLQGYILQAVVRPTNLLSIGLTGSYRFEKADPRPSRSFYGYITYSNIPGIRIAATGTVTWLETSYVNGKIYGIGISRDLVAGKLFAGLTYRYTDYSFNLAEDPTIQNVGEVNISWRIWKRFSLSVYYEGTFESSNQFNRIFAQLNLGF